LLEEQAIDAMSNKPNHQNFVLRMPNLPVFPANTPKLPPSPYRGLLGVGQLENMGQGRRAFRDLPCSIERFEKAAECYPTRSQE